MMTALRPKAWAVPVALVLALLGPPTRSSAQVMDQARYLFLLADNLELAPGFPGDPFRLEGEAWYGGSYNRLWVKLDGDLETQGEEGEVETQALFSHLFAPFWDLQAGIRVDGAWGDETRTRTHAALGIQGLAPYWFEVEAALFVSTEGDVSADLQASYDVLFTNRLVLEPEIEVNASFGDVPDWGVTSGITGGELGFRFRYEIQREFAPYLGYVWRRNFGGTADLRQAAGEARTDGSLVAGFRAWY